MVHIPFEVNQRCTLRKTVEMDQFPTMMRHQRDHLGARMLIWRLDDNEAFVIRVGDERAGFTVPREALFPIWPVHGSFTTIEEGGLCTMGTLYDQRGDVEARPFIDKQCRALRILEDGRIEVELVDDPTKKIARWSKYFDKWTQPHAA